MEVEFKGAGSRAGDIHGLRRMYVKGLMENRSIGLNRVKESNVHVIHTPHHSDSGRSSIDTVGQNSEESNESRGSPAEKPAKGVGRPSPSTVLGLAHGSHYDLQNDWLVRR